jgi:hypothetical protein
MCRIWQIGAVLILAAGLSACTGQSPRQERESEQVTLFKTGDESVVIHSTFGSSDIKNWRAVDNNTLIIETYRHGRLVATFFSPCPGIRYAETIGFSTMGPFDLDRSTTVILPDGQRCHFKELKPYVELDQGE